MLHGRLEINGITIGTWEAVRAAELAPGWHEYEVRVDSHGQHVTGTVAHRYADGPAVLATLALGLHSRPGEGGMHVLGRGACGGMDGACGLQPRHRGRPCLAADDIPAVLDRS